jgi:hypothetical protein
LLGDISKPAQEAEVFCPFLNCKPELALGQLLPIPRLSVVSAQSP